MTEFIPAEATVFTDNDRVCVTRYRFPPLGETGWHRHEHAYVVVPTIGGTLTLVDKAGHRTEVEMTAGVPYFRERGVSHNVVNFSARVVEFVETEIKRPATGPEATSLGAA
jgi:mannose-6-phosphate isomerase-like protein (cupin superfamily)